LVSAIGSVEQTEVFSVLRDLRKLGLITSTAAAGKQWTYRHHVRECSTLTLSAAACIVEADL
jgi:hypothetical protein